VVTVTLIVDYLLDDALIQSALVIIQIYSSAILLVQSLCPREKYIMRSALSVWNNSSKEMM